MKHFDLFSGYGGFAQAGKRAYENNKQSKGIQQRINNGNSSDIGKSCVATQSSLNRLGVPNGKKNGRGKDDQAKNDEARQGLVAKKGKNIGAKNGRISKLHDVRADEGAFITIGFSEIDQYANKVLAKRFPGVKNYGDITKINWAEVPDFDILTGGSPCQDLSIAGKRAGLDGRRSGLFYEYMRAVKEKRPKYFIWENVKGALSSQNGWDFGIVISEMAEAGYNLWWQVLNAKDFGIPQNRERVFVVGFRDQSAPEILLEPGGSRTSLEEITRNVSDAQRVYTTRLAKSIKALGGGMGAKTGLYATNPKINTDGMRTLNEHPGPLDEIGLSDTQRYKLCGNGVVVNVVEEIIKNLIL